MAELSDEDLTRFENEFNELRSEVFVFRAILGAIMANAVASREKSVENFDELRVQPHIPGLLVCSPVVVHPRH